MSKSVFVLIKCEHDDGCEWNDPYGSSETTTVIGVCSQKQLADEVCKTEANEDSEFYGSDKPVNKTTNEYTVCTDNGWISYAYKEFELDKEWNRIKTMNELLR